MRSEELFVRGVLSVLLLLLAWIVASVLLDAGTSATNTFFLCASVVLLGIAFGAFVKMTSKPVAFLSLGLAILGLMIFTVLQYHLIPICGDNVCSAFECGSCSDCSPAQCADGVCEADELCSETPDCACGPGQLCTPQRPITQNGCYSPKCADNYCDIGENAKGCCVDCGCEQGFFCRENLCYFITPELSLRSLPLVPSISVTSLAGNPYLTDNAGVSQPLVGAIVRSSTSVRNASITFAIDNLLKDKIALGHLHTEEIPVLWFVSPKEDLLRITQNRNTNITIKVEGIDAQGDRVSRTWYIPFTVTGRSTLDELGHLVLYVERNISTKAKTPSGIWDELRNISLVAFNGRYQFPSETLLSRKGSEQDFALLLASAYENAEIRPILVQGSADLIPDPDKLFIRIHDGRSIVTIDPSRVQFTFEEAIVTTPGAKVYDVALVRKQRNFTALSLINMS